MTPSESHSILITQSQISTRVRELAEEILAQHNGQPMTVILLLKGAILFAADLCRHLPSNIQIECLSVSSYHGGTESSGTVTYLDAQLPDVSGRSVLLVDDILDTGLTLYSVSQKFKELGATHLSRCVLLSKKKDRLAEVSAEHVGFEINDEFVIGYGLDYQGRYRNLPYIGVMTLS